MINYLTPESIFRELFVAFQTGEIVADEKSISDAIPLEKPDEILSKYHSLKSAKDFDLKSFFFAHFHIASPEGRSFVSDTSIEVDEHIRKLWKVLYRAPDDKMAREGHSLIPLKHPYIVPGGRFNEIYYWDSYFTMLGLKAHGEYELIESMIENFAEMIRSFGFIPNGNRSYFLSRSQPPFFSLMVLLLYGIKGQEVLIKYLPALEKEYAFWMNGQECLSNHHMAQEHVVYMGENKTLNRYFDKKNTARVEMFATDLQMASKCERRAEELFANLRAACESGWDFSSRWLKDPEKLESIISTHILPVDLNCLLYQLERTLCLAWKIKKNPEKSRHYKVRSKNRKDQILSTFWKEDFFYDYDFFEKKHTKIQSLAGIYPLFFKIADKNQAQSCAKLLEQEFLKSGGLLATTFKSGQQWDAPNGWAPLQYIAVKSLENYGYHQLADKVRERWIFLNKKVYKETGKLLEKYNVVDIELPSGGGEYPVQDGFGWTNGVLASFLNDFTKAPEKLSVKLLEA